MFRAWKDAILSHHSLLSGKGLENEKHRFSMILAFFTLSFLHAPCNLAEGPPPRNFGLSNERGLGLLS